MTIYRYKLIRKIGRIVQGIGIFGFIAATLITPICVHNIFENKMYLMPDKYHVYKIPGKTDPYYYVNELSFDVYKSTYYLTHEYFYIPLLILAMGYFAAQLSGEMIEKLERSEK